MSAVIFDLDGTLIDNTELLLAGFRYAYQVHNLEYPGDEYIFSQFGQPLKKFLQKLPGEIRDSFRVKFRSFAHNYKKVKYHAGIPELLEKLGDSIGIVTSKEGAGLKLVNKTMRLDKYFKVMISSTDIKHPKPSAEGILLALRKLGVEPSYNSCYVGDTIIDIEAARNAKVSGIGIGWSRSAPQLKLLADKYENVYFAESIHDLENIIIRISGRHLSYN